MAWTPAVSNSPFLNPAQPISPTVLISWPAIDRDRRQSTRSSNRISRDRFDELVPGLVQKDHHLLAGDRWKAFEKFIDRVASLEMIEESLKRHAGSKEHRRPTHNFWIARNDWSAHANNLRLA